MAVYHVKYNELQNQVIALQNTGKTIASFEDRLKSIANSMDVRDSLMTKLKEQVMQCVTSMPALAQRISLANVAISSIAKKYLDTEKSTQNSISQLRNFSIGTAAGPVMAGVVIEGTGLAVGVGATVVAADDAKAGWWDKFKSGVKSGAKAVYNVGKNAVQAVGKVVSVVEKEIGPGGRFEGAWLAVKTTTKLVEASVLIACSAASIVAGNPAGVLGVIYGVNSFANAATDLGRIDQGQYDKVGSTNYLKTGMEKGGEAVIGSLAYGAGYLVGGEDTAAKWGSAGAEIGKTGGTFAYEYGEIYTKVAVGNTVISDTNQIYSKVKDVMKLEKSSAVYGAVEKVVDWVDDPAKEIVKKIVPESDTFLGELAEKSTEKIVNELVKPVEVT